MWYNFLPMQQKNHLVWMDLEMTGLDPDKERIIEIATAITDFQLDIVAEGPSLVIRQSPGILKKMDDWNQTQHAKSGLIELVKKSKITVKEAEKITLDFLKQFCYPKKSPLCGNSIHHDRRFLINYMPKIHDYLHYRHIDVSAVRACTEMWFHKDKDAPKKKDAHRSASDLGDSIEELRYLRKTYFRVN